MAGHILELRGCTPEPLGNYLKGLGVFRLIAEQADPQARAWWQGGVLWLHTKWSLKEVLSFFLTGIGDEKRPVYGPTPIFAPWGGRPGFYNVKGNEGAKQRLERLERLCDATGRFALSKATVEATRHVLKARTWDGLDKKAREKVKGEIVDACRANWPIHAIEWFDACLSVEDDPRFGFLYGTGGNEGSADITNNFWELIEETIGLPEAKHDSRESLVGSLVAGPRAGGVSRTAGQHFPLAAGCSNCGQDFEGSSSANPWDFILMMEGAVLFAGATTKRLSQFGKGKAAFPFMVDHVAIEGS